MLIPAVRWRTAQQKQELGSEESGPEKLLGFLAKSTCFAGARKNLQGLKNFPEHVLTTSFDSGTGLSVEPAVFAPLLRPNEPAGTGQGVVVFRGCSVSSSAPVQGSLFPSSLRSPVLETGVWAASNSTEEYLGARLLASALRVRVAGRGPRNLQPIPASAVRRAGATCGAASGVRFTLVPPSDLPVFLDPHDAGSSEMADLRGRLEDLSFPQGKGVCQSAVFPAVEAQNEGWVCFAAWQNLSQICGGVPGRLQSSPAVGSWEVPPVAASSPLLLGFAQNVPAPERLFEGRSNARAITRFQPVCDQVVHLRAPSLGKAGVFGHSDLFGGWGVHQQEEQAGGSFWSAAVAAEDLGLGHMSSWLVTGNPRSNGGQGAVSFAALKPHKSSVQAVFTPQPLVAQLGQITAADILSAAEVPSLPPKGCQMVEINSSGVFQAVWAAVQGFAGWASLGKVPTSLSRFYGHSRGALYFRIGTEQHLYPDWLQESGPGFEIHVGNNGLENIMQMHGHSQVLGPQWFRIELVRSGERFGLLMGQVEDALYANTGVEFLGHSVEISPGGFEAYSTYLAETSESPGKKVRVAPFRFQKEYGWVLGLLDVFFEAETSAEEVPFESFRLHLAPGHGLALSSPLAPQVLVQKKNAIDPGSEIPHRWESSLTLQALSGGFSDVASGGEAMLAGVTSAGEIQIFSASWQQTVPAPHNHPSTWTANRLAFSPDGEVLAAALGPPSGFSPPGGAIYLFKLRNGNFEPLGELFAAEAGFGLAWDRRGQVLVARSGPQGKVLSAFRVNRCSGSAKLLRTSAQGLTSRDFSRFSASGNIGVAAGLSSVHLFYLGELAPNNRVEDFLQAPSPAETFVGIEVEFSETCSVAGFELVAAADSQTARKTFSKGLRVLVCSETSEPELVFETSAPLENLIEWRTKIPSLSGAGQCSSGPLLLKKQYIGVKKIMFQVLRPESLPERNLFGFSLSQLVFWQEAAGEPGGEYLTEVSIPASGNSRFFRPQKQVLISEHLLESFNLVPAKTY